MQACWPEQCHCILFFFVLIFAMEDITAELDRVTNECRRLQRQAQKERARRNRQRELALLAATIAFCHEPTSGRTIAEATLRKHARVVGGDVDACAREIETRFLETPVDLLAQWLNWSDDIPRVVRAEAQRLVEDAGLLVWIGEQNSAQGVAPPPQFVWEKRCALAIDSQSGGPKDAAPWRPARSAAAKKWMQRFRRRWNLTLGRLPTKDLLPLATMQAKVRSGCAKKVPGVVPPPDAFRGPWGGPRFGAARLFSVIRGWAKTAPFLLPFCTFQDDRRVAVVSLPGESSATRTPGLAIESGRDQR